MASWNLHGRIKYEKAYSFTSEKNTNFGHAQLKEFDKLQTLLLFFVSKVKLN